MTSTPGPKLIAKAEMPPLIGMAAEPLRLQHAGEQRAPIVELSRLEVSSRPRGFGVEIRLGHRTDRINRAPHLQRLSLPIRQGEINRGTRAVGWWR